MDTPDHLFVYGTLLPGQPSWGLLEPFVVGLGEPDWVRGELFDTGLGYPAATTDAQSTSRVAGRTFELIATSAAEAFAVLDEFEDVADGLYRRVIVTTGLGMSAWTYVAGSGLNLTVIESGEWLRNQSTN